MTPAELAALLEEAKGRKAPPPTAPPRKGAVSPNLFSELREIHEKHYGSPVQSVAPEVTEPAPQTQPAEFIPVDPEFEWQGPTLEEMKRNEPWADWFGDMAQEAYQYAKAAPRAAYDSLMGRRASMTAEQQTTLRDAQFEAKDIVENPPDLPEDLQLPLELDPKLARVLGHQDLADSMEEIYGSVFGLEPDPVKAKNLILVKGQKPWGKFGSNPNLVMQELTQLNVAKEMRRRGVTDFFELPVDEIDAIKRVAADQAERTVKGIQARGSRAGTVVDLDPDETVKQIRRGNTAINWLTGIAPTSIVNEAITGIPPEEQLGNQLLAPFQALMVAGGRPTWKDEEVLGQAKEGTISWMLRLAPSTAIGAYMFDDDPGMEWGSKEHVEKIYEGYDITREMFDFGRAYTEMTPFADSDAMTATVGFGGVASIVLLEPDLISLMTAGAAKPVRAVAKLFDPGRALLTTYMRPFLREAADAIESGRGLDEVEATLKPWSPKWIVWQQAKERWLGELASEYAPIQDVTMQTSVKKMDEALQQADDIYDAAVDRYKSRASDFEKATERLSDVEVKAAQDADIRAVSEGLTDLTIARTNALRGLQDVAEVRGIPLREVLKGRDPKLLREFLQNLENNSLRHREMKRAYDALGPEEFEKADRMFVEMSRLRNQTLGNLSKVQEQRLLDNFYKADDALRGSWARIREYQVRGRIGKDLRPSAIARAAERRLANVAKKRAAAQKAKATAQKRLDNARVDRQKAARGLGAAGEARKLLVKELRNLDDIAGRLVRAMDEGNVQPARFDPTTSATRMAEASGQSPGGAIRAVYGDEAYSFAKNAAPDGARHLDDDVLTGDAFQDVLKLEEAAHMFVEHARVADFGQAKRALATVRQAKAPGLVHAIGSPDIFEQYMYQTQQWLKERMSPVLSRGMAMSEEWQQDLYRTHLERFSTGDFELNAIARDYGPEKVFRYLTSDEMIDVGGHIATGNQDVLNLSEKALLYLKMVAEAGKDAWKNDINVRAIAGSAAPGGTEALRGFGMSIESMRQLIRSADVSTFANRQRAAKQLIQQLEANANAAFARMETRVDATLVTRRFIYRGIMAAAAMHDTAWDMVRLAGPMATKADAAALDFLSSRRKLAQLGVDRADDLAMISSAQDVMARLNLPSTQALKTGAPDLTNWVSNFYGSVRTSNELVAVAAIRGQDMLVPRYLKEAIDSIPRNLAKELEQFHDPGNPLFRAYMNFLRLWRLSVVQGAVLPRAKHYVNTYLNDINQVAATSGYRAAAGVAVSRLPDYAGASLGVVAGTARLLPFGIGKALGDRISGAMRASQTMAAGMMDPHLPKLLEMSDEAVEVAEGQTTYARLMREAQEAGMRDSLSSNDLAEVMGRASNSTLLGALATGGVTKWVEDSARMLEAIQHRTRLSLYMQYRKTMAPKAAENAVKEQMYDWRLGVPRHEVETIGMISAFWAARRNSWKQLGAALSEAWTAPGTDYIGRAMTGRTKIARYQNIGQILDAIPEAVTWQDGEMTLDDQEQLDFWLETTTPWWSNARAVYGTSKLGEERKLWYSEMAGRDVTVESLVGPMITTNDALFDLGVLINMLMATITMGAETAGVRPGVTTVGSEQVYQDGVKWIGGLLMPDFEQIFTQAAGVLERKPVRGIRVDRNAAIVLNRLGWSEFVGAYRDKDGEMRYQADSAALTIATMLISSFPHTRDILQHYGFVDNPALREGVGPWLMEFIARYTGIVTYAPGNPVKGRVWDIIEQENALEQELKEAQSRAGAR